MNPLYYKSFMYRKYQNSLVQASHLEDLLLFLVFNQTNTSYLIASSYLLRTWDVHFLLLVDILQIKQLINNDNN